jgi:hypothetical protein
MVETEKQFSAPGIVLMYGVRNTMYDVRFTMYDIIIKLKNHKHVHRTLYN